MGYEKYQLEILHFDVLVELLSEKVAITFREYEYKDNAPKKEVLTHLYLFDRKDGRILEVERRNQDRVLKRLHPRKVEKAGKFFARIEGDTVYVDEPKTEIEKDTVLKFVRDGYAKARVCKTKMKRESLNDLEKRVMEALNKVINFDTTRIGLYTISP